MSGMEVAFLSALGTGSAATATTAATTGLFGAGGAFSLGQTLATVGTGLGALGNIRAGQAEAGAARYNAEMANREAANKANLIRQEGDRRQGQMRAAISKSGVRMEGTPLMVLAESAANNEIDAMNAIQTGQMTSNLYRAQGTNARRAGNIRAGTSLLTGLSRIY